MGLDDEKFPRKLRNRGEIVVQAVVTRGRRRSSSLGSKNLYRRALYFVISVSLNHGLTRRFSSRSITRYRGSIARLRFSNGRFFRLFFFLFFLRVWKTRREKRGFFCRSIVKKIVGECGIGLFFGQLALRKLILDSVVASRWMESFARSSG